MGDIDINVKNFIKINSVFAQLFEKGVYHGAVHIESGKLKELDEENHETTLTNIESEWEKIKRATQEAPKETPVCKKGNTSRTAYRRDNQPGRKKKEAKEQTRQSAGSRTQLSVQGGLKSEEGWRAVYTMYMQRGGRG